MRLIAGWFLVALGFLPGFAFSAGLSADEGGAVCANLTKKIDQGLKVKELTVCIPGSETKGGDTNLFMLFAKADLDENGLAYWVTALVDAVSDAMGEGNGLPGVHAVYFQDHKLGAQKRMLTLTADQMREIGTRIQRQELKSSKEVLAQVMALQASGHRDAAAPAKAGDTVHITLLQVNDVYQAAPVDKGKYGGLARVAAMKSAIAAHDANTLMIFGGDTLSPSVASSIFKGKQMIAAWNAVGVDYAVLGNHEFDFGDKVLLERIGESHFPWLAANVLDKKTGKPFGNGQRYVIRDFEGVKVGFFGLLTPDTASVSNPGKDVIFAEPIKTAKDIVAELKGRGVNTVVVLTHQSMSEDKELARAVPVDVILGGHEHALMQALAGRTPIFKMGSDARNLGRIELSVSAKTGKMESVDWEVLPVTQEVAEDARTAEVVKQYENQLASELGVEVGKADVALDARQSTNRSQETNLGSFIADLFRKETSADATLINGGAIRSNATYGPGKLTRKDVLSILPFENPIVAVEVSGQTLRQALEHGLSRVAEDTENGRFPQVSGMHIAFDASRPAGSRLVQATIGGQPLDDKKMYRLATNTYLLGGGDGYTMLRGARLLVKPEDSQVEPAILMNELAKGAVAPRTDGRIERLDKK